MENVTIKHSQKMESIDNKIIIDNRNKVSITGISQVISSNDTAITMLVKNTRLIISGKDLHIEKLDVEHGLIEAGGTIDSIKYNGGEGLIKRIFK
jgi:sporulation protein YabP